MKQQLLKKAEEFFLRFGIRSVSMDDIARELGVSKKTLYQHVENKEDLILQIFTIRMEEESLAINEICENSENAIEEVVLIARYMIDRLRLASPSFHYDLEKYYPTLFKRVKDFHWDYFLGSIEANLEKGKLEKLYRADLSTKIIARLFMGMMNNISQDQIFTVHEFPLDDLLGRAFFYHIHGIASESGREALKQYMGRNEEENL